MARRFTLDGAKVAVLEKAADVLDGASKANSAILHTGFDAPPRLVGAKACIADGLSPNTLIFTKSSACRYSKPAPWCWHGIMSSWHTLARTWLPKAHKNGWWQRWPCAAVPTIIGARAEPFAKPSKGGFIVPGEYLIDPWATRRMLTFCKRIANGAMNCTA